MVGVKSRSKESCLAWTVDIKLGTLINSFIDGRHNPIPSVLSLVSSPSDEMPLPAVSWFAILFAPGTLEIFDGRFLPRVISVCTLSF